MHRRCESTARHNMGLRSHRQSKLRNYLLQFCSPDPTHKLIFPLSHSAHRCTDKLPATRRWRLVHSPIGRIERNGRPLLLQGAQYRFPGDKCRGISHTEGIAEDFIAQRAVSGRCGRVRDRVSCHFGAEGKTCVVGI